MGVQGLSGYGGQVAPVGLPMNPNAGLIGGQNKPIANLPSGNYATPLTASNTVVDPSGSSNHLPVNYFTGGSSAQWMPTGGSGLGALGTPSQSGCSICDFISANFIYVVGAVALILILLFVAKR